MRTLDQLLPRRKMEERGGGNASWMWMMRERQENARGNEVHTGLIHQDLNMNTTRREIVSFYENIYSDLVDLAQTLKEERDGLRSSVNIKDSHIKVLEQDRDERTEAWAKAHDRFETLMDLLVESRGEKGEELPW